MARNTYLYKALQLLNPSSIPKNVNLFDWLTELDLHYKKNRFLLKPLVKKKNLRSIRSIYTNRTFTCPKCKKNKTYRDTKQTRGGDEGETIVFICKYCKTQYKV